MDKILVYYAMPLLSMPCLLPQHDHSVKRQCGVQWFSIAIYQVLKIMYIHIFLFVLSADEDLPGPTMVVAKSEYYHFLPLTTIFGARTMSSRIFFII